MRTKYFRPDISIVTYLPFMTLQKNLIYSASFYSINFLLYFYIMFVISIGFYSAQQANFTYMCPDVGTRENWYFTEADPIVSCAAEENRLYKVSPISVSHGFDMRSNGYGLPLHNLLANNIPTPILRRQHLDMQASECSEMKGCQFSE